MTKYNLPILERFHSNYLINPTTNCWEWTLYLNEKGYGTIQVNGVMKRAHRLSYELFKGPIPDKLCVCHTCDNPKCVNPNHLWLGTNTDNVIDKMNKGRHPGTIGFKGIDNPNCKLSNDDVLFIKNHPKYYGYMTEISKKFNISKSHICAIRNGSIWSHLA